jgi:hypothetical protein
MNRTPAPSNQSIEPSAPTERNRMSSPLRLSLDRRRFFAAVGTSFVGAISSSAWGGGLNRETINRVDDRVKRLFARSNLVAWCVVPFDAKKRKPAERATMSASLGFKRIAYDWRDEHVPEFESEIVEYKKNDLEYFAFWGVRDDALALFAKHRIKPQLWVTPPQPNERSIDVAIDRAADELKATVAKAKDGGLKIGLYNHGGRMGEPANLVALCERVRADSNARESVGIVYNLHHAHDQLEKFDESLGAMKPHLYCLNVNGMAAGGDRVGKKILPIGQGELDESLFKSIVDSGYDGPIGIIGHTDDDVELRLRDNLDGLDWLSKRLCGEEAGERPTPRTMPANKVIVEPGRKRS